MEINKEDIISLINVTKADFRTRIDVVDEFSKNSLEKFDINLKRVEIHANETVNKKEDDLRIVFEHSMEKMERLLYTTKEEFILERKQMIERNVKTFTEIKNTSMKFLSEYDIRIIEVEQSSVELGKKYANWSKILIEP